MSDCPARGCWLSWGAQGRQLGAGAEKGKGGDPHGSLPACPLHHAHAGHCGHTPPHASAPLLPGPSFVALSAPLLLHWTPFSNPHTVLPDLCILCTLSHTVSPNQKLNAKLSRLCPPRPFLNCRCFFPNARCFTWRDLQFSYARRDWLLSLLTPAPLLLPSAQIPEAKTLRFQAPLSLSPLPTIRSQLKF